MSFHLKGIRLRYGFVCGEAYTTCGSRKAAFPEHCGMALCRHAHAFILP